MAKALQDAIILFGDSMTEAQEVEVNLQSCLSAAYSRKLDVLNRGFSGYNTNGGRMIWDHCFSKKTDADQGQRVRMVTIWHGTNDAYIHPGSVSTPLPVFLANMNHFLFSLTSPFSPYAIASTPVSIILITLHPIILHMRPNYHEPGNVPDQDPKRQREFRDAILELGKEWKVKEGDERYNQSGWKVEVLDLWEVMVRDAGGEGDEVLEKYFTDGTHFNSKGYSLLWKAMSELIKTKFKGRGLDFDDADDLPERAPLWGDIDWTRPEQVLDKMALPAFR